MKILGIETSCDETAAAIVEDGKLLHSNVISSQVDLHARFGGIVPEVASRQHILEIAPIIQQALSEADIQFDELGAVAVTCGPGLAGALLVGVNFAKALASSLELPLIGINHLEGHIYASWLMGLDPDRNPGFPLLCLIASGGHTDLIVMSAHGTYQLIGRTRDDAAGEAFDKAARILGLGFPGGPEIQKVAVGANGSEKLPRAWLKGTHDFSFSGLKTAILHKAQFAGIYPFDEANQVDYNYMIRELGAAFQDSVVDVITRKTLEAAKVFHAKGIIIGGGVTANLLLRQMFREKSDLPVFIPDPVLCTDNGAMIAACAYYQLSRGIESNSKLDVYPSLGLGTDVAS